MTDLPEPLTPADCNLRHYPAMPLEVERLKTSITWRKEAKKQPELGYYLVNLWTAAWREVPCGSLEDDDETLRDLAGCTAQKWPHVKKVVLRSWVRCRDGRLYHPVICELALAAWQRSKAWSTGAEKARAAKAAKEAANRASGGRAGGKPAADTEPSAEDKIEASSGGGLKGKDRIGREGIPPSPPAGAERRELPLDQAARHLGIPIQTLTRNTGWQTFGNTFANWTTMGADPDLDIWPTIVDLTLAHGLKHPNYYGNAIAERRRNRMAAAGGVDTATETKRQRAERKLAIDPTYLDRDIARWITDDQWTDDLGPRPEQPSSIAAPARIEFIRENMRRDGIAMRHP